MIEDKLSEENESVHKIKLADIDYLLECLWTFAKEEKGITYLSLENRFANVLKVKNKLEIKMSCYNKRG